MVVKELNLYTRPYSFSSINQGPFRLGLIIVVPPGMRVLPATIIIPCNRTELINVTVVETIKLSFHMTPANQYTRVYDSRTGITSLCECGWGFSAGWSVHEFSSCASKLEGHFLLISVSISTWNTSRC